MTETEKTELRIKAAKALGMQVPAPDDPQLGTAGYNTWQQVLNCLPDPLDSSEDCEALLVATFGREWMIASGGSHRAGGDMTAYFGLSHDTNRNYPSGFSNNPDRHAAYREAVTRACVAACEVEQEETP